MGCLGFAPVTRGEQQRWSWPQPLSGHAAAVTRRCFKGEVMFNFLVVLGAVKEQAEPSCAAA